MRTFTASAAYVRVPVWHEALGAERHIVQFPVLLVAATKKAAIEMLVDMGLSEGSAELLVKQTRAAVDPGRDWQMVLFEDAIDLDEPGLYLSQGGRKGSKVIRAISTDRAEVIGEFGYDPKYGGRGLFFVPARRP